MTKRSREEEDVEVVALSPGRLTTKNWFQCPLCDKGFPRNQNLQLHLRGHKLDGKLEKRDPKAGPPRRKVYVCPVSECVRSHPARALGDVTAARKHYSRKHHNKKPFKCETCSNAYAVEADIKAHTKICRARARSFACSCGTSFTKEEDLKTHKTLCDAFIESDQVPKSDEVVHRSKGKRPVSLEKNSNDQSSEPKGKRPASLEKNSNDQLSNAKGKRPVFSLYNFAPLDTNSPAFLDTTPPVEDNDRQKPRQNEYSSVPSNISNSLSDDLSPTFISITPESDADFVNDYIPCLSPMEYETPRILSLSKDHPMMISSTSSMTYPLHETSSSVHGVGDETSKVKIFNQEFSHGFRVGNDKNNILNAKMKEQATVFPSQDSDFLDNRIHPGFGENGATGVGLNSFVSNGHMIGSNLYQHNGWNNGLNSSPWNYIQQRENPFSGGEGSSSSPTTKLFGQYISTERADEVGGLTNNFHVFGNWVNENQKEAS